MGRKKKGPAHPQHRRGPPFCLTPPLFFYFFVCFRASFRFPFPYFFLFVCVILQSELSHDVVQSVLREYRLHSCDVIVREDVTIDQFIDVVEGNRKYMPCLYVMNKIDQVRQRQGGRYGTTGRAVRKRRPLGTCAVGRLMRLAPSGVLLLLLCPEASCVAALWVSS